MHPSRHDKPPAKARRVVLGLGSNLGDRVQHVRQAAQTLACDPRVDRAALSRLYETDPVGGPEQGPYVNAALLLHTSLAAPEVLELAMQVERDHGRQRLEHWGPRTLDVDVLWIEGESWSEPHLIVPHRRLLERAFALVPLLELAPDATDPTTGVAFAEAVSRLGHQGMRPLVLSPDSESARR